MEGIGLRVGVVIANDVANRQAAGAAAAVVGAMVVGRDPSWRVATAFMAVTMLAPFPLVAVGSSLPNDHRKTLG